MPRSNPWYLTYLPRPDARLRLYCFACAGSGPSFFRGWPELLPPWIEVRAVRLPGRPGRHREAAFTDADQAVKGLLDGLAEELTGDYAFFGHSMGALLAYRMTRELLASKATLPRLLAGASWPPQGAPTSSMPDPADDDADFAASCRRLGGVPDEMFDDPAILGLTLPLLRADFALCHSYTYDPAPPLPLPVVALNGSEDSVIPPHLMTTWQEQSEDFRGLRLYPGGHFFVHDHAQEVTALLTELLAPAVEG